MSRVRQPDPLQQRPADPRLDEILEILREMNARQRREAERRDEYRGAYLRAKFPFGDHRGDRWGRRSWS